jgi:hypothetical protein
MGSLRSPLTRPPLIRWGYGADGGGDTGTTVLPSGPCTLGLTREGREWE